MNGRKNSKGFIVYERDCPADETHMTADLASFTYATKGEAQAAGDRGEYAYKR